MSTITTTKEHIEISVSDEKSEIMVQQIDIVEAVKKLAGRMRNLYAQEATQEQIRAYDTGAEAVIIALKSRIDQEKETNRLIYQKYGGVTERVKYMKLEDVLKEIQEESKSD